MIDWILLGRLGALVMLATIVGVPAQIRAVVAVRGVPHAPPSAFGAILGLTAVGLVAATAGTALAPRVGLTAPVLGARLHQLDVLILVRHLGGGVAGGILVALILPLYHWGTTRFDPDFFQIADAVRRGMGLPARLLLGGVLEEIVYRWGVLLLVAWIGVQLTGGAGPGVQWTATVLAALAFAGGHLPGAAGLSSAPLSAGAVLVGLTVNVWFGLVAGWLLWHQGLAAAMVAHATVHVIWTVVEGRDSYRS
jgi:hypothetical protein